MDSFTQQSQDTYNLLKIAFKPGASERLNNKSHFDNIVEKLNSLRIMYESMPVDNELKAKGEGTIFYAEFLQILINIMYEKGNIPEIISHDNLNGVRERVKSHFFSIFGTAMGLTEGGRRMSYRSRKMKKHKKSKSYKKIRKGKRSKRRRY